MSNIQWFPGHMQKARRQMEEQLKLVDMIIELRDARIPLSSYNPMLEQLAPNKERLIVLNKADCADPIILEEFKSLFISKGQHCIIANSVNDNLTKIIVAEVKTILKTKLDKAKARGIRKKVLRAMVVGIPNVGKSTFINNIVKKKVAKAENRPGVTRALQWVKLNEDVELLDTPGVLYPKIENELTGIKLALLGSINDEILDKKMLVNYGLSFLLKEYPGLLNKRYGIDESAESIFEEIARARGCLSSGSLDEKRAIDMILKDIRNNNLGPISWEKPDA
ncbi:MAG: ribosome biogenesis GTPase YlqF [Erysipelotrichaceae bacterium]|nr:ribosome biogenesis GTPase YlqF [Erysipelotrichaceae bacterium]